MKIGIIGAMDKEIVKFNEHFTLDTIEPNLYKGNMPGYALNHHLNPAPVCCVPPRTN